MSLLFFKWGVIALAKERTCHEFYDAYAQGMNFAANQKQRIAAKKPVGKAWCFLYVQTITQKNKRK
jgi:hypothetical protein